MSKVFCEILIGFQAGKTGWINSQNFSDDWKKYEYFIVYFNTGNTIRENILR